MSITVQITCDQPSCHVELALLVRWSAFIDRRLQEEAELAVGWRVGRRGEPTLCPDHHPNPNPISRRDYMRMTGLLAPHVGWAAATNIHDRDGPLCAVFDGCMLPPDHPGLCQVRPPRGRRPGRRTSGTAPPPAG